VRSSSTLTSFLAARPRGFVSGSGGGPLGNRCRPHPAAGDRSSDELGSPLLSRQTVRWNSELRIERLHVRPHGVLANHEHRCDLRIRRPSNAGESRLAEGGGRAQGREAVAQTIACLDFLYVCDKVTILG
jgi:hypothetical protein